MREIKDPAVLLTKTIKEATSLRSQLIVISFFSHFFPFKINADKYQKTQQNRLEVAIFEQCRDGNDRLFANKFENFQLCSQIFLDADKSIQSKREQGNLLYVPPTMAEYITEIEMIINQNENNLKVNFKELKNNMYGIIKYSHWEKNIKDERVFNEVCSFFGLSNESFFDNAKTNYLTKAKKTNDDRKLDDYLKHRRFSILQFGQSRTRQALDMALGQPFSIQKIGLQ